MRRVCEFCGRVFEAQRATRKTCSEPCRAKLNTRKRRLAAIGATGEAVDPVVPGPSQSQPSPLADVPEQALRQAGKLDTPVGNDGYGARGPAWQFDF